MCPEIISVELCESESPLCMSTEGLPPMVESDEMGNLGWI